MNELRLVRTKQNDRLTLGRLYIGREFICFTLERPWRDNLPNLSCVPAGTYKIRVRDGAKDGSRFKYKHIHVLEVPGRSWILFHRGNHVTNSKGCILVGLYQGTSAVWSSQLALNILVDRVEKMQAPIRLKIEDVEDE